MRFAVFVVVLLLAACATEPKPQINNYQTKGNLQALSPIRCIELAEVTNQNTPADIFPGVQDCMNKKDYSRAAKLFALAGSYGRFDRMRVTDQSAHQAVTALQINHLGSFSKEENDGLLNSITAIANNPDAFKSMCAQIKKIGPPAYYPSYMVQHGMGAFIGGGSTKPIKEDLNTSEAWNKAVNGFLRCA
jgi:hypothetical protein